MSHDEMITVIAAHRDGKPLQWKYLSASNSPTWFEWFDLGEPKPGGSFNFQHYLYRIKPEPPKPREWWIVAADSFVAFASESDAQRSDVGRPGTPIIHVREVLPDEEGKA